MISARLKLSRLKLSRLGLSKLGISRLGISGLSKFAIRVALAVLMSSWQFSAARASETQVSIDNFTFAPASITVKIGDTVTWTNRDDIPHTIVSAGKFRSKALDTDNSFSFTFTAAGDYQYFCSLHPHMTGIIKVE
jgi:plastocyanin